MLGILSVPEIESLLHSEVIARIGCHSNGHTYVVPVTYAYDGESIVGYSPEGLKLAIMRENPLVCVEVDHIDNFATWRSVIASGQFEVLEGSDADAAREQLSNRLRTLAVSATATPSHGLDPHARALNRKKNFVYRIRLKTKTGRFEKPEVGER